MLLLKQLKIIADISFILYIIGILSAQGSQKSPHIFCVCVCVKHCDIMGNDVKGALHLVRAETSVKIKLGFLLLYAGYDLRIRFKLKSVGYGCVTI